MYKCNICGDTKDIVYTSLLDGNICRECNDKFFVEIDGDIKSKMYNKPEVMDFITRINNDTGYTNLVKAVKDIQQRYNSCIIGYCIESDKLRLDYRVQYKGKELLAVLTSENTRTDYKITLENDEIINRVFE